MASRATRTMIVVAATISALSAAPVQGAGPTITVFGCVQREADYLTGGRANPTLPSVIGQAGDHELVLVHAYTPEELQKGILGTSGRSYQLGGEGEIQLEQYIGQRVEVTGIVQTDPIGTNGPSGGPHALVQPKNRQLAASLVDLRVLDVLSMKPAIGACPAS